MNKTRDLLGVPLVIQVRSVRLVDDDGIVRPVTFYKYLMVWYNMDFMGYTMSQVCVLVQWCPEVNRLLVSHAQLFYYTEACEIIRVKYLL